MIRTIVATMLAASAILALIGLWRFTVRAQSFVARTHPLQNSSDAGSEGLGEVGSHKRGTSPTSEGK